MTVVAGAECRYVNKIETEATTNTASRTLTTSVHDTTTQGSKVFTDDAIAYIKLKEYDHKTVKHSIKEFVNGIESFWAFLKRDTMWYITTCRSGNYEGM